MSVPVKFFKGHSFLKIHFYQQYFRPKRERRKESLWSVALKHLLYNLALCDVTKGRDGSLVALPGLVQHPQSGVCLPQNMWKVQESISFLILMSFFVGGSKQTAKYAEDLFGVGLVVALPEQGF